MREKSRKALFLDRDGVINEDFGYVYKIEDFKFKDGIFELLRLFQDRDYDIFIVTNQSGIGRDFYTKEDFLKLMDWVKKEFKKEGIVIKDIAYCPHHPNENCQCRKPKPKMILDLKEKYNLDLKFSIMLGDKESDELTSRNAGLKEFYYVEKIDDLILKLKSKDII